MRRKRRRNKKKKNYIRITANACPGRLGGAPLVVLEISIAVPEGSQAGRPQETKAWPDAVLVTNGKIKSGHLGITNPSE